MTRKFRKYKSDCLNSGRRYNSITQSYINEAKYYAPGHHMTKHKQRPTQCLQWTHTHTCSQLKPIPIAFIVSVLFSLCQDRWSGLNMKCCTPGSCRRLILCYRWCTGRDWGDNGTWWERGERFVIRSVTCVCLSYLKGVQAIKHKGII